MEKEKAPGYVNLKKPVRRFLSVVGPILGVYFFWANPTSLGTTNFLLLFILGVLAEGLD